MLYKTRDGYRSNEPPAVAIILRGCEVTPEVNLTQGKFNIKLEVPSDDGIGANNEMWIRCDTVSGHGMKDIQMKSISNHTRTQFTGGTICQMDGRMSFSIKRTFTGRQFI